jgi:uncharacterized membrane protein (GlpM family)
MIFQSTISTWVIDTVSFISKTNNDLVMSIVPMVVGALAVIAFFAFAIKAIKP